MAWHMGTIRPTLRFDLAGKRGCRVVSGATFCHLNELKGTVLGACHLITLWSFLSTDPVLGIEHMSLLARIRASTARPYTHAATREFSAIWSTSPLLP